MDTRGRERSGKGEEGESVKTPLGNVSFMCPTVADTTGGKIYRGERRRGEQAGMGRERWRSGLDGSRGRLSGKRILQKKMNFGGFWREETVLG